MADTITNPILGTQMNQLLTLESESECRSYDSKACVYNSISFPMDYNKISFQKDSRDMQGKVPIAGERDELLG